MQVSHFGDCGRNICQKINNFPQCKRSSDSADDGEHILDFLLNGINLLCKLFVVLLEHIVAGQVYIAQDVASRCAAARAGTSLCRVNDVQFIKTHRVVLEGFGGFLCRICRVIHCVTDATNATSALGEISEHNLHTHQLCHPLDKFSDKLDGGNQRGKNGFHGRVEQRANRFRQHIQLRFQNLNLVRRALDGLCKVALHIGSLLHNSNVTQNRLVRLRQTGNLFVKA